MLGDLLHRPAFAEDRRSAWHQFTPSALFDRKVIDGFSSNSAL
jgi:hypothetical protein